MTTLVHNLELIDWDFNDYNSAKYPLDINSIHWYPATFPPPIPNYLISLFSDKRDTIFDPFCGAGTTAIEATKLNRRCISNDINPFAIDIIDAKFLAIKKMDLHLGYFDTESDLLQSKLDNIDNYLVNHNINLDVKRWFEESTLKDLCEIYDMIICESDADPVKYQIRKCAFSSILNRTSSQNEHYTYVTDKCWPKEMKRKDAKKSYLTQIRKIAKSATNFSQQFHMIHETEDLQALINQARTHIGDSRHLEWMGTDSVDLIVTSPPYVCSNDYINSLRLTDLFFPVDCLQNKIDCEIGSRSKRKKDAEKVVGEFYEDMSKVFDHLSRILKPQKYLCLIMGQGSGKVTKDFDTVTDIANLLTKNHGFKLIYRTERNISYRRIRLGGVRSESIMILQKD